MPDVSGIVKLFGPFAETGPFVATKEFCDKRNGELMNLETWFSGKCGKDVKSSIQGEGVGFVDIIALQGMESLFSLLYPPYMSVIDYITQTIGWIIENSSKILNSTTGMIEISPAPFANRTLAGGLSTSMSYLMTTKPASTTGYIEYIASNLKRNHIISDTYAAGPGYGFQALSPVLPIWRAFRNISYILFALAFVIYGIMIMFRIRIDSKTAATIQLAIPKLITTLLLITFSYAIVGILVDFSTVLMALSIDVLRVGGIITGYQNSAFIKMSSGQSGLGLIGSLITNGIVGFLVTPVVILNIILGGILGTALGTVTVVVGFLPFSWGVTGVLFIIFILALLFAYGKIFFSVLKSYIAIIINLIFAPIMILMNIFPGSNAFSSWVMTIVGNLAVFPVISFFLVLSYSLMMQPLASLLSGIFGNTLGVISLTQNNSSFWTPPMTSVGGAIWGGATGNSDINSGAAMLALVGLMFLFMASKYADMVLEALKVPPFKYGSAISDALKWGSKQNNWLADRNYEVQTPWGSTYGVGGSAQAGRMSNVYGTQNTAYGPGATPATVNQQTGGVRLPP